MGCGAALNNLSSEIFILEVVFTPLDEACDPRITRELFVGTSCLLNVRSLDMSYHGKLFECCSEKEKSSGVVPDSAGPVELVKRNSKP